METPKPTPSSLFETEARRIADLNRHKVLNNDGLSTWGRISAIAFGISAGVVFFSIIFIPLTLYAIFAHGYVAMKIWEWYIVPAFGVAPITWMVGGAFMILIRLFTYKTSPKEKDVPKKERMLNMAALLVTPWYMLLIAWAIKHFFM